MSRNKTNSSNDKHKPAGRKTMLTEPSPRMVRNEIIAEVEEISDYREEYRSETLSYIPDEHQDSYGAMDQSQSHSSDIQEETKSERQSEQKSVSAISILKGAAVAYDAYVEKFKG